MRMMIKTSIFSEEEEKVRSLENGYKTAISEDVNSNVAIEAYHEWHSAAVIYLGKYFSNADADFIRFKNIDNTGNGYNWKIILMVCILFIII